jgi:ribonuclease D
VTSPIITDQGRLHELCERLQQAEQIGIDTEFVSEDTFYPELCLIQIATCDEMAVVDPQQVDVEPFWRLLVEGDHTTILHAGREELNFLLRAVNRLPQDLFDIQIAAGFCSNEFPAAYGSVVSKFIGHKPQKGQQRTDWRLRPLSSAQLNYALEDVRYLLPVCNRLRTLLSERGRLDWLADEMSAWQALVVAAQDRQDWRRVSGIGKLNSRSLAIVRELWRWRYEEAKRQNKPQKRLLRDDLLVELARHQVDNPKKITAIRGMNRGVLRQKAEELAECVRRGLRSPEEKMPRSKRGRTPSQLNLLGQFLTPALNTICQRATIAASMVGTASDVRELISYRLGFDKSGDTPSLTQGWRAELVGNLIDELIAGKKSIRIKNPHEEDPLVFDEII